ncbi:unnamed protein product [Somion occarium]|uniref:Clavaminate synthase-like protein n=1 Tax=Somion occarium TaxID=3059160 RepID=A0ABP1DSX4_9APHY
MSSTTSAPIPDVPRHVPAPPTKEELEYADLAIIDLSKAATPEGRAQLATQVRDAMRDIGFLVVINHGYTQEQRDRIFDIADYTFTHVSDEEKRKYEGKPMTTGSYQGYKLPQYWHIDNGVQDRIEQYNTNRIVSLAEHPEPIRPLLPEIREFGKYNHFNILHPILRLLALGLELPEDTFVNLFNYENPGESSLRFIKYFPRSEEDEVKTKNVWLKGHTDLGGITLLWSQPVSALQILSPDGKWRWAKHIDNALIINAGDAIEFLSGGYYRATIHRVVQPPPDQRGSTRLGVFYFSMPDDSVKLTPLTESPVLQREGVKRQFTDENAPFMEQWRKGRIAAYGKTQLKKGEGNVEEEYINGVLVKHYN